MRLRWPSGIVVGVVAVLLVSLLPAAAHLLVPQTQTGTSPASSPGPSYSITFNESGLPNGTTWNVTLNGTSDGVVGLVPVGPEPAGMLYDVLNGQVYATIRGLNEVSIINPATETVVQSIPVGSNPRYMALDPATGDLFVTNTLSNNVTIIDGSTNSTVGSISVGSNPIGITFDPVNGYLYVADSCVYCSNASSNVSVVNAATDSIVRTIPVGLDSRDISYDPLNGLVYAASYDGGNVTIINSTTNSVSGSIDLGLGFAPSAPAVDLTTGNLYVVNNNWGGQVAVVDPVTNTVLQWITLGAYPAHPFFDGANGYVYIANEFSDNVSVVSTASNTVIGSIPAGDYPASMAIDTATGNVYVASWDSSSVMVVNGAAPNGGAGTPITPETFYNLTTGTSGSVQFLEPNGSYFYSISTGTTYVVSPSTGEVTVAGSGSTVNVTFVLGYGLTFDEYGLSNGTSWNVSVQQYASDGVVGNIPVTGPGRGMLYDAANGQLYLAGAAGDEVTIINTSTDRVLGTVTVGTDPRYIALDPTTGDLYVTNTQSNNVTIINSSTDAVAGSIAVGQNPIGIVFDPANGFLYVADSAVYGSGAWGNVSVINATTDAVLGTIPVGPDSRTLSLDPLNGNLYVANYGGGNLTVINSSTERVSGSIELGIGYAPSQPDVDPVTGALYISINDGGIVAVVDPVTGATEATIPVGSWPAGSYYDPANGYIYVGNEFSDNVSVIEPTNNSVVGSIPAGSYPATIAFNPSNDTIYVANWYSNDVMVVDGSAALGGATVFGPATTLGNTTALGVGQIGFALSPGTVSFTVGAPEGYFALPESGTVNVTSGGTNVGVNFVQSEGNNSSNVTFSVKGGLPAGKSWTVDLGSQSISTTSKTIVFHEASGSYTYLVTGPSGHRIAGIPIAGTAVVNGTGPTARFTFVKGTTYSLTLQASGLPKGQRWCVVVGAELCSTHSSISISHLPVGSYGYSIASVAGQEIAAKIGKVAVPLSGEVTLSTKGVTLSIKYVHPYTVTVNEIGLPAHTSWTATVGGSPFTSSLSSMVFELGNGSYSVRVGAVAGYTHSISATSVHVHGAATSVTITFRPRDV